MPFTKLDKSKLFTFSKQKADFEKCHRVLRSCRTLQQTSVALCMIHNLGRAYGHTAEWTELDAVGRAVWYFMLDDAVFVVDRYGDADGEMAKEAATLDKGKTFWLTWNQLQY